MNIKIASAVAENVAARWMETYYDKKNDLWRETAFGDTQVVHQKLLACANDPEKLAAIIGNKSWTHISCDGCSESVSIAAVFSSGGEPSLCLNCLTSAQAALKAVKEALQ